MKGKTRRGAGSRTGLWSVVRGNRALGNVYRLRFSFFKPNSGRDWRSFGAFMAFNFALFVETYGFPLTFYLFSGWMKEEAECRDRFGQAWEDYADRAPAFIPRFGSPDLSHG